MQKENNLINIFEKKLFQLMNLIHLLSSGKYKKFALGEYSTILTLDPHKQCLV